MAEGRDESLYLANMLSAIDRALEYTAAGHEQFMSDAKTQDAVICNIEVMGEAAKAVSSATRAAHPEIPWAEISATRDQVLEEYFRVDLDIVWAIVEKELPPLRERIAALLPAPRVLPSREEL
jgi:uncharacterized protein with HEPN domain